MSPVGPLQLMDTAEVAAYLGIKPGTLDTWRCTKKVKIPYIKIGSNVRYRLSDVEAFVEKSRVTPKPRQ
jgi:excisionase family DNA binding protein